jgi:sulfofructose kinase
MTRRSLQSPSDCFNICLPQNKTFDVVGLGMNAVDRLCVVARYPTFNSKSKILHYRKSPGGPVATAMTFLARMGLQTKYIGKVGSDELGLISVESLRAEGIDTSCVVSAPGIGNQHAFIVIDQSSGERTVLWQRDPALNLAESEVKREDVCSGRILHLDGADQDAALRAACWARAEGIPVVIDLDEAVPRCEEIISQVDFLITSSNFPSDLTGIRDLENAMLCLGEQCHAFVAATLGAEGAMAVIGGKCVRFQGFHVRATDTTGAGDVFHGGFIYGLLQGWPLEKIVSFSNAAAALNCKQLGAREGIVSASEILEFAGFPGSNGGTYAFGRSSSSPE